MLNMKNFHNEYIQRGSPVIDKDNKIYVFSVCGNTGYKQ